MIKLTSISFLTAAALGLLGIAAQAEETIKIGLAVPLTGDFAPYNEVASAQCMVKMINNAGGINGKKLSC